MSVNETYSAVSASLAQVVDNLRNEAEKPGYNEAVKHFMREQAELIYEQILILDAPEFKDVKNML